MRNSKNLIFGMLVVPIALAGLTVAFASDVTLPHTYAPNTPARASEINENFAAVKSAVDDNFNRIINLANDAKVVNQSVMTTAMFTGLAAGSHTLAIFVRGDCDEVLLNRGNFDQQVLVQEGSGTPSQLSYAGEDFDTTLSAVTPEVLRTIGTVFKSSGSGTPLLVTWKAHCHVSGPEGSFADFQVRVDGNEGEGGSRVVMFIGR